MSEKEQLPSKIFDVVSSLTDAAQQAAILKAKQQGFSIDAGEIPLEETLINLSNNRDVLLDAVKKGRIVQLPLKIQYRLLSEATKVKTLLETLIAGTSDVVASLSSAIDDLTATVWEMNLQNTSDQVLAFDSKMNQLKDQEAQIKKVIGDAKKIADLLVNLQGHELSAKAIADSLTEIQQAAQTNQTSINESLEKATESAQKVKGVESVVEAHETKISHSAQAAMDSAAAIAQAQVDAQAQLADISTAKEAFENQSAEISTLLTDTSLTIESAIKQINADATGVSETLKEDISTLISSTKASLDEQLQTETAAMQAAVDSVSNAEKAFDTAMQAAEKLRSESSEKQIAASKKEFEDTLEQSVSEYREKFSLIEEKSNQTIKENDDESKRLTEYLAELESRVHDSIERATGYTLFHSFQKRQEDLVKSKNLWALATGICVLISLAVSAEIVHSIEAHPELHYLVLMKLAISLPFIYAITFCGFQYSRERRLEEEYAFKSSISISLEPYRKLVKEVTDDKRPEELSKYTDFIIASISKVFTSPTNQVFDGEPKESKEAGGLLKTAGDIAENLIKAKMK